MSFRFSKNIIKCQLSGKRDLKKVLSLGFLPPVNNYFSTGIRKKEEVFFPAEIFYSKSSKLIQLGTIVDKDIIFPKNYPYTSSTTKILRDNFKELYLECKKIIKPSEKDLIIDIGSNDGNLLSNFKKNHKVLGITPEKIGKIYPNNKPRTMSDEEKNRSNLGFIAQEVENSKNNNLDQPIDNIVNVNLDTGLYTLSYDKFVVPLVKAIQELKQETDNKINVLSKRIKK